MVRSIAVRACFGTSAVNGEDVAIATVNAITTLLKCVGGPNLFVSSADSCAPWRIQLDLTVVVTFALDAATGMDVFGCISSTSDLGM